MNSKTFHITCALIVILLGLAFSVQSVRVNITNFRNCEIDPKENMEHFVSFSDVSYECNADGYCDIVHAKYNIPTVNDADKLLNITMWRCGKGSTDTCLENPEHFIEVLHCERFHKDITGPWAMIADGMADHSKCGAVAGDFELINAKLKVEYLTNYMVHDVDFPRHHMRHMIHKKLPGSDEVAIRACVDMEFTVIFD